MNTIPRLAIAIALLAAVSACGNKGPLVQAPPPQPAADEVVADPELEADPAATAVQAEEVDTVAVPETDAEDASAEDDEPAPAEDDGTP